MTLTVEKCMTFEEMNYVSDHAGLDEDFSKVDLEFGYYLIGKLDGEPVAYFIALPYKPDLYDCHVAKSKSLSSANMLELSTMAMNIVADEDRNMMGFIANDNVPAKRLVTLMGFEDRGIMGPYTFFWRDCNG